MSTAADLEWHDYKCNDCGQKFSHAATTTCPFCKSTDIVEKRSLFMRTKTSIEIKRETETGEVIKKREFHVNVGGAGALIGGIIALVAVAVVIVVGFIVIVQLQNSIVSGPSTTSVTTSTTSMTSAQTSALTEIQTGNLVAALTPLMPILIVAGAMFLLLKGFMDRW